MRRFTKVYVLMWDTIGYGLDTVAGVFYEELAAERAMNNILENYPTNRYVPADFRIVEKEIE